MYMTMKPTIAYVDGFNLFYGLLKGTKDLWLDPVEFVRRLLRQDHDIQKVKYFSAPLKPIHMIVMPLNRRMRISKPSRHYRRWS